MLWKYVKVDLNTWKDIPCSWIRGVDIVKMAALPKLTYRFRTIPFNFSADCFAEVDQLILKFIWKYKAPRTASIIFKN